MKRLFTNIALEGIHVGDCMDGLLWTGESLQAFLFFVAGGGKEVIS